MTPDPGSGYTIADQSASALHRTVYLKDHFLPAIAGCFNIGNIVFGDRKASLACQNCCPADIEETCYVSRDISRPFWDKFPCMPNVVKKPTLLLK